MFDVTPYDKEQQEDEIDLYDILDVLIKRKWTIVITTIIFVVLAFCSALYYSKVLRTEKYALDFSVNYNILNNDVLKKNVEVKVYPIMSLLNNDVVVEEFFEIGELQKLFDEKKYDLSSGELEVKRKFLKKVIIVESLYEKQDEVSLSLKRYSVSTELKKGSVLHKLLIDKFWEIVSRKIIISTTLHLENFENISKNKINDSFKKLEESKVSFQNLIEKSHLLDGSQQQLILDSLFKFLDPPAYSQNIEAGKYYEYYSDLELVLSETIEKIKDGELLVRETSIYKVETKGKGLMILAIGSVLGVFFGIFLAFVKEFFEGYKKRKIGNSTD
ncbi:MAG: hypothetical protein LBT51_04520 [Fusobacteriaceae bacterium]|jgi:capsular polysaccharide biosynthesis protein|nr:hypothetical protein [Fusobacteriaceae bacterium]